MSTFNFKDAKEPTSSFISKPGKYVAKIIGTTFIDQEGKNPYLSVKFETNDGSTLDEKFYITSGTLWRLGVLYQAVWDTELDKEFTGAKSVADFFDAALKKDKKIGLRVLGEKYNGKVYHKLPYKEFIYGDLTKFEEKQVDENDPDYHSVWTYVAKQEKAASSDTVINKDDKTKSWDSVGAKDESDDLPF